jgi:signal transduction histidine kinase
MAPPRTLKERLRHHAPVALAIALTALLVVLAVLQQSWLAKVSEAERGRARAHVDSAAAAFSRDFNEPLSRLAFDFLPLFEVHGEAPEPLSALGAGLARRLERWRATAAEPDLLAALWLAERERERVVFRRLDEASRAFLPPPAGPPPALERLARRIAALPSGEAFALRRRPGAAIEMLDEKIPALILPLADPQGPLPDVIAFAATENPERRPLAEALHWRMAVRGAGRWLVLELDRRAIVGRILPLLAERHFGDDAFGLRVVAKDDPDEPIFAAGRPMPADATIERSVDLFGPLFFSRGLRPPGMPFEVPVPPLAPEAAIPLLPPEPPVAPAAPPAIAPFDRPENAPPAPPPAPTERRDPRPPPTVAPARPVPAPPSPPAPVSARPAPAPSPFGVFFSRTEGGAPFEIGEGRWRLEVFHQEGSLDAAIDRAQQRNLTLALGILLVLGASMLFLAASARKAQALARRQLELVAGVTHELLTPLAAMKSAGQNLRDGVVQEAPKVSRYGELIVKESDRLSGLVGQVLSWAGLESQATAARRELLDPAQVAREALEDLRPGLETANFEVVFEAQDGLPPLLADPAALRQGLGNLIANAIKYGKPEAGRPYLRLAVEREKGGRRVAFIVADRGPGIAAEDLPHIFEPFYRGRRVVASNLAGAGLGLALVRRIAENHAGELAVASAGNGATFSLLLPAAEAP